MLPGVGTTGETVMTHVSGEQAAKASFPEGCVCYYWPRGFLLLAPSFIVDRGEHPTRRPSIRLMLSLLAPFEIEFSNGSRLKTRAVLMSAGVRRRQIIADACNFVLLDMAVSTPEYATLVPLVASQAVLPLEPEAFEVLLPQFEKALAGQMNGEQIRDLRREAVHAIAGAYPQAPDYDPRVEAALGVIQQRRLEDVSLDDVAQAVHLSPDRLRHLFKEQVGHTVSHFARTNAVWKALSVWSEGQQLTHLAHEVGFHDYSHFSHAFREMFGFNPGLVSSARRFKVIGC
jgi:AraC family transcriptional regulator, arabinose operon regulatory protein